MCYPIRFNTQPEKPEFHQIIKRNLPLLECDKKMNEVIDIFQIIKSKRQSPSLKKILTRAKFGNIEETPAVRKCQKPRCATCPYLQEGQQFKLKKTEEILLYIPLLHVKVPIKSTL